MPDIGKCAAGFLCNCMSALAKDTTVEVTLSGDSERYAGQAQVVRKESSGTPWHRYGFKLLEKTQDWPFQAPEILQILPARCCKNTILKIHSKR